MCTEVFYTFITFFSSLDFLDKAFKAVYKQECSLSHIQQKTRYCAILIKFDNIFVFNNQTR